MTHRHLHVITSDEVLEAVKNTIDLRNTEQFEGYATFPTPKFLYSLFFPEPLPPLRDEFDLVILPFFHITYFKEDAEQGRKNLDAMVARGEIRKRKPHECPYCKRMSMVYDENDNTYFCSNKNCLVVKEAKERKEFEIALQKASPKKSWAVHQDNINFKRGARWARNWLARARLIK